MPKATLVDLSKCMGCRGCQVACKQWNDLPAVHTEQKGTYENPPDVSPNTWSLMKFKEIGNNGTVKWVFSKWQCMHCLQPACVEVCPTEALYKTAEGPVLYDESRCIGCQYCRTACPFSIPRFDWETGVVQKCTFCMDRIAEGMEPACIKTCPPGALLFDERETIVTRANEAEANGAYLYGKDEVGGTSWIYVSGVPFDELGFPDVGTKRYPAHSAGIWGSQIATIVVGAAALGLYSLYLRRKNMKGEQ